MNYEGFPVLDGRDIFEWADKANKAEERIQNLLYYRNIVFAVCKELGYGTGNQAAVVHSIQILKRKADLAEVWQKRAEKAEADYAEKEHNCSDMSDLVRSGSEMTDEDERRG